MSNVRVSEINKEIAELSNQNLILNRLRSKRYMGSDLFMEQTNEINQLILENLKYTGADGYPPRKRNSSQPRPLKP